MNTNFKLEGAEKIKIYPSKVSEKPLVSVCVPTYKHEKYIKQCLDGILMQQTNFEFEILLGEDDSPDKTREICIDYANKYPDIIRLFLHDRSNVIYINGNPTGRYNIIYNLNNSNGKYIAMCEGDDYWTDPLKLQKQVDFLEMNKDFVLTYGNAKILDETGSYHKKGNYIKDNLPKVYSPINALSLGLPTLTMLFRNINKLPNWFVNVTSGDYFLRLILSKQGKFYYHGDLFGVHRKHVAGVSRTHNKLSWNLNTVEGLKKYSNDCELSQKKIIKKKIMTLSIYIYFLAYIEDDKKLMIKTFYKLVGSSEFYSRLGLGLFKKFYQEVVFQKKNESMDIF